MLRCLLFSTAMILTACSPSGENGSLLSIPVKEMVPVSEQEFKYYEQELRQKKRKEAEYIISKILRDRYSRAQKTTSYITVNNASEPPIINMIMIFDDVPEDDSISGHRYDIRLQKSDGVVKNLKVQESWRCWPDRGHRYFSAEPCN